MLILQGLNASTKSCERVQIDTDDLDNLYFTFDSIYLVNKSSHLPFIYDSTGLQPLLAQPESAVQFLSFSTNTNYFWCLATSSSHFNKPTDFLLFQYSNKNLIKSINISIPAYSEINDLVILSTDVNLYVLENGECGLKCLYQMRKKADLNETQLNKENLLSESSTSCLPLNQILIDEKVSQFACGKEHILFLTATRNRLYAFGLGTKGQLGLGKIENRYEPTLVNTESNAKIVSICAGGWHSAYLDEHSDCYLWGWNLNGQVSIVDADQSVFVVKPTKLILVDDLSHGQVKFASVSLGSRHTAVIDSHQNLYTFGWNKYKQLFVEQVDAECDQDDYNIEKPIKIEEFEKQVKKVKCGCWLTSILI